VGKQKGDQRKAQGEDVKAKRTAIRLTRGDPAAESQRTKTSRRKRRAVRLGGGDKAFHCFSKRGKVALSTMGGKGGLKGKRSMKKKLDHKKK